MYTKIYLPETKEKLPYSQRNKGQTEDFITDIIYAKRHWKYPVKTKRRGERDGETQAKILYLVKLVFRNVKLRHFG